MISKTERKKRKKMESSSESCSSEKATKANNCKSECQSIAGSEDKFSLKDRSSIRKAPEDAFVHTLLPEGR